MTISIYLFFALLMWSILCALILGIAVTLDVRPSPNFRIAMSVGIVVFAALSAAVLASALHSMIALVRAMR